MSKTSAQTLKRTVLNAQRAATALYTEKTGRECYDVTWDEDGACCSRAFGRAPECAQ